MRFAVDTNRYTDFCRNDPATVELFQSAHEIFIPFVVLGELRAGFKLGKSSEKNERNLVKFLNLPGIRPLHPDDQTSFFYASIFYDLRKKGTPIPTNDLWIGALVLQHELVLFTRDAHFDLIPQIPKLG
ncbi:MAG: vapC4 [Bacteriovoracaceae bacterium]|nr:vapC4 [Bacteriovoracaceae bacterium]